MQRLCLLLTLALLALTAALSPGAVRAQGPEWLKYTDPRYGFSIDYPSTWQVFPRQDVEGTYGGVLTFAPHSPQAELAADARVVVGLYTSERETGKKLADWSLSYLRRRSGFDTSHVSLASAAFIRSVAGDNGEAFGLKGESPLTRFQVTNIPRARTVWFVWTNADSSFSQIYEHMVNSFRFGRNTPTTLADAFGPVFRPQPREVPAGQTFGDAPLSITSVIPLPDTWWVPTPSGQTFQVLCGSSAHTGSAEYATDIQTPMNTSVCSSRGSWVDFASWDSTGYGNLIRTSTDYIYSRVYTAYYAHLSNFYVSAGQRIGTGALIASSGNSGPSTVHLHFHVRSGSDAVNLATLVNFDENSNYPSGYANCGSMYR